MPSRMNKYIYFLHSFTGQTGPTFRKQDRILKSSCCLSITRALALTQDVGLFLGQSPFCEYKLWVLVRFEQGCLQMNILNFSQAVASSCWSVMKQKRQHMKVKKGEEKKIYIHTHTVYELWYDCNNFLCMTQVPDGFIAHLYAVCEQISPVLAWGFLGPKNSLHDFCCFFKVCMSLWKTQND